MPESKILKHLAPCIAGMALLIAGGCGQEKTADLSRAETLIADRQFHAAVIELKSHLRQDSGDGRARRLLGEVYLTLEDYASAEKELRTARSLGVADGVVVPLLARSLIRQRKAREVLDLHISPDSSADAKAQLEASRALASLAVDQQKTADNQLAAAIELSPTNGWVRFAQASLLIAQGSPSEATIVLERLVTEEPGNGIAWSLLANSYVTLGELEKAEAAFSMAIAKRFDVAYDRLRRGETRLMRGAMEAAADDAEFLMRKHPSWVEAAYFAGKVRFRQQHYAEAKAFLESAYLQDINNFEVVLLLARTSLALKDLERAESLAEHAYELAPGSLVTARLLAGIYLASNKPQRAESLLDPLVMAHPREPALRRPMLASLMQQGKQDEAVALLERLMQLAPEETEVRIALARLYLQGNDAEHAVALLSGISQTDDDLLLMQADAFARAALYDEARQALERLLARAPHSVQAHRGMARILMVQGNLREAQMHFRAAKQYGRQASAPGATP